jgi:KipI family sensor histidine kinase inhibitor
MKEKISFAPRGDNAVQITFGYEINEEINQEIRKYFFALIQENIEGVVEVIPSYCHLNVIYNGEAYYYEEILDKLYKVKESFSDINIPEAKIINIPVLYGEEYGPDIENVASHNNLSVQEVIDIHSSGKYLIYMLGFTPGFPYLGGMDEKISTPRLKEPREKIWAGSVGIAGNQTGIYPIESPGGWQIIGRTPIKLFDINRKPEILLQAGDYISFYPISKEEFDKLGGRENG